MKFAAGTIEYPFIQWHRLSEPTPATILASISRVNFDEYSASFCRFASQHIKETRPSRVRYAFGKGTVFNHAVDRQIFHENTTVTVHNLAAVLVGEVITPELDTLVSSGYYPVLFSTLFRTFREFITLGLYRHQRLFFLLKEFGVFNLSAIREGSKSLEANVNPNVIIKFGQLIRFNFNRKASVPLLGSATPECEGFDNTLNRAVKYQLDIAYLGNFKAVVSNLKATLGIKVRLS